MDETDHKNSSLGESTTKSKNRNRTKPSKRAKSLSNQMYNAKRTKKQHAAASTSKCSGKWMLSICSKKKKAKLNIFAVKNTDKSLHSSSEAAKTCQLCHKKYKRMVMHYRMVHKDDEVFVSRIAQHMVDAIDKTPLQMIKYIKYHGNQYLKMQCPFCETTKDFFASYWLTHIRNTHTGEYANECVECGEISLNSTHCGQSTTKQK